MSLAKPNKTTKILSYDTQQTDAINSLNNDFGQNFALTIKLKSSRITTISNNAVGFAYNPTQDGEVEFNKVYILISYARTGGAGTEQAMAYLFTRRYAGSQQLQVTPLTENSSYPIGYGSANSYIAFTNKSGREVTMNSIVMELPLIK